MDIADLLDGWSAQESGSLQLRLADALEALIDAGRIPEGDTLPPSRELAKQLLVGRSTVTAAYDVLKDRGKLTARRGEGTRVSHGPTFGGLRVSGTYRVFLSRFVGDSSSTIPESETLKPIDLVLGAPMATAHLDAAAREAATMLADYANMSAGLEPRGIALLREKIALECQRAGLPTTADQIIVTSGAEQAIDLVIRHSVSPNTGAILQETTFSPVVGLLRSAGADISTAPTTGATPDTNWIANKLGEGFAPFVFLVLTHHVPTGETVPAADRADISHLASENPETLIVDDWASDDLRLTSDPTPAPLAAWGDLPNIVTVGSVGKLFWHGIRVGWIRVSADAPDLLNNLARLKLATDLGTSVAAQLLASQLLEHADEVRHERQIELAAKHSALTGCLKQLLPEWEWQIPMGGTGLWVKLPRGSADDFAEVAATCGVLVTPGSVFSAGTNAGDQIRLSYVQSIPQLEQASQRLSVAWEQYSNSL